MNKWLLYLGMYYIISVAVNLVVAALLDTIDKSDVRTQRIDVKRLLILSPFTLLAMIIAVPIGLAGEVIKFFK